MKKTIILFSLTLVLVLALTACSSSSYANSNYDMSSGESKSSYVSSLQEDEASAVSQSEKSKTVFTLEELSKYNGKNGEPAYVAVNGVVYDVTDVPEWKNGEHKAGLMAGNDLTKEITEDSPHGLGVLDELPVVGTLTN